MRFCEKYRGKTFGEVIPNICFEVSDYTIRLEDYYFRYSKYYTEFRISPYIIFNYIYGCSYYCNQEYNKFCIDLTNLVGEMNDIV